MTSPLLSDPRLIVGLDVPAVEAAEAMVDRIGDVVTFYKVGLTLLTQPGGVDFARSLRRRGKAVFQDWKLHDIGAQVEGAARSITAGGCDLFTVHAEPQVMRAAVEGRGAGGPRILAVTVLTSLSDQDLADLGYGFTAVQLVERRVRQALDCGVDGVVSSPLEAAHAREIAAEAGRPDFLIVTPGVRPSGADAGDQQRIATPTAALQAGASHLVVARPIVADPSPKMAAARIAAEMSEVPPAQSSYR